MSEKEQLAERIASQMNDWQGAIINYFESVSPRRNIEISQIKSDESSKESQTGKSTPKS